MPKACFVVRALVEAPSREKFDHWYATDHFPEALAGLKPEKGWRFWSTREPGVHYAVYRFADLARLEAALKSDAYKALAVDFDRSWPAVARTATCSTWCRNPMADVSAVRTALLVGACSD